MYRLLSGSKRVSADFTWVLGIVKGYLTVLGIGIGLQFLVLSISVVACAENG